MHKGVMKRTKTNRVEQGEERKRKLGDILTRITQEENIKSRQQHNDRGIIKTETKIERLQ